MTPASREEGPVSSRAGVLQRLLGLRRDHPTLSMVLLLFSISVVLPTILYSWYRTYDDSGYFIVCGWEWYRGRTPYLDFVDNKPPGIWAVAYLCVLLGNWISPGAVLFLASFFTHLACLGNSLCVFHLGKKYISRGVGEAAAIVAAIVPVLPFYDSFNLLTEPYSLLFSSLAVILILRGFKAERLSDVLLASSGAGLMIFMGFLFKQTAVFLAGSTTLFFMILFKFKAYRTRRHVARMLTMGGGMMVGFAVPMVLVSLYFHHLGVLHEFLDVSIFSFLKGSYGRRLDPNALRLFQTSGLFVFSIIASFHHIRRWFTRPRIDGREATLMFMVLWFLPLFYTLTIRQYGHYVIQFNAPQPLIVVAFLGSIGLPQYIRKLRKRGWRRFGLTRFRGSRLPSAFILLMLLSSMVALLGYVVYAGINVTYGNSQQDAANYINEHMDPDDPLLVFRYDPALYYLTGKDPPTPYCLHGFPFITNDSEQLDFIHLIERENITWVIMEHEIDYSDPTMSRGLEIDLILAHLNQNFTIVKSFKYHDIMRKKSG